MKYVPIGMNTTPIQQVALLKETRMENHYQNGTIYESSGIQISDRKDNACIPLADLLSLINGSKLNWALLWLRAQPKLEHVKSVFKLSEEVNDSPNGLICSLDFLLELAEKIFQEFDLLIIGSKSSQNLHRYKDDQEMYETCDVVIEIIDGGFWEVFSLDPELIAKLKVQFHQTKPLNTDFQKKLYDQDPKKKKQLKQRHCCLLTPIIFN